jgi:hypothetical protein
VTRFVTRLYQGIQPEDKNDIDPKPETRNPKSETRNPKPETRNPKPETRNPKSKTRNPKPETRSPKPKVKDNIDPHMPTRISKKQHARERDKDHQGDAKNIIAKRKCLER